MCAGNRKDIEATGPLPRAEALSGGGLLVCAAGKINLNLLVGPPREDGYHSLDSLVAKVTLYDEIELRLRSDGRIGFSCCGADCGEDEHNLALRAAKLLADGRDVPGADIVLRKRIPPGKGLGGGSSDAAAVLRGLNELWRLGLSKGGLAALAAELSSDAPLFLGPPGARMTGRGERIESITVHPFLAVLWVSDLVCSTTAVYKTFDHSPAEMGKQLDPKLLAGPPSHWRGLLENQLAPAAEWLYPQLRRVREEISVAVSKPVCLTGSGSALFVLCNDLEEARQVLAASPERLRRDCIIVASNPW
jgi:4-diphosphocytidyl-2-C-methyl-D-erythritol kinase